MHILASTSLPLPLKSWSIVLLHASYCLSSFLNCCFLVISPQSCHSASSQLCFSIMVIAFGRLAIISLHSISTSLPANRPSHLRTPLHFLTPMSSKIRKSLQLHPDCRAVTTLTSEHVTNIAAGNNARR